MMPNIKQSSLGLPLMASAASALILCLLAWGKLNPFGVDAAWHYTIVEYLSEFWCPTSDFVALHPTMGNYPPAAHGVGALVGLLVNSPFQGMHLAGVMFTCLAYAFLLEGVRSADPRQSVVSLVTMLAGVLLLHRMHIAIGEEITGGNYFYAQLGGHAAAIIAVFVLSDRERTKSEAVGVPLIVLLFGWLYPLAQLHILAASIWLWAWSAAKTWIKTGTFPMAEAGCTLAITVLGGLAVRFHPTYELMRVIANNEGGGTFNYIPLPTMAVTAGVLFVISIYIALGSEKSGRDLVHPYFIAAMGAGVSLAFFAHYAAFVIFDTGSVYGVRKHVFAIGMLFVVSTAILIGRVGRSFPIPNKSNLWSTYYGISLFVATAFICWMILVAPMTDARSFESYQKAIRAEARQHPEMYGTTVSRVDKFSVAQNFAVTMVDLRVSDLIAIKHVLTSDRAPDNISAVIVDKTSVPHSRCNLKELGGYAMIVSGC